MPDIKDLNNEELEKVSGGGDGTIPSEGVVLSDYTDIKTGRYYCDISKNNCVAYVHGINPHDKYNTYISFEVEYIRYNGNRWYTIREGGDMLETRDFRTKYPKILNLIPGK